MRQWFFARQGQTKGPYNDEQLRGLARSGQLLPNDLVSYSGAGKWIPASEVPNLFAATPVPAAPAPAAPPLTPADASRSFLEPLFALPKPLIFAIFGGIGGLMGALLLGEVLWAVLSPASFRPSQPQVQLGIPSAVRVYLGGKNRFAVNLSREGFQGPVRIEAENPPEGVKFSTATIAEDKEDAEVEVQADKDLPPGTYSLTVRGRAQAGTDVRDHASTIELTVEPLPAQLLLSVPTEVAVYQGGKAQFRIKLARHHFSGPVKLHFQGLPEPIAVPDTIVDKDSTEAEFTIKATESTKLGEWPVALIGTRQDGEGKRAVARFNLRVRSVPVPQADIVFVLDLTGSMQFAIDGIKLGIQTFATELEKSRIDARLGLIGFRDLEVDKGVLNPLFVMTIGDKAFTKDYEAFKTEVGKLRANGGGDIPESSLQALALAAKQPFRPNASSVLLLITDAPPKIHRSESPSTVQETIDELEKKRISQLHLVVRPSDYRGDYAKFHPAFTGKHFDLSRSTTADAFRDILPKLSREISTTIAAKPRTLDESPALPDLPVESQAAPPRPEAVAVVKGVQSTQAYTHRDRYRLLLAIAVWTMVMSGCISLLILAGQRYYACRRFAGLVEGSKSLGGGFLAGLVGGAAGQLLFQNTAGGTAWEVASRLLGWGLLGGLIGGGMSFFVPNLKWWRGLVGGLIGGLLGAGAFVVVSLTGGAFLGRWIGAGILGFFIGLMVALAELAFRRYWLEIAFSPREVRTVTLGTAAVSLGGDERRVAVAVPGSPPIVFRYWINGERVMCEDVIKERTEDVDPGDRKTLGKVTITLCSAAHGRKTGCTLQLSNGASFLLVEGLPLTEQDLPGLHAQGTDKVVALVSSRPNDPTALLLRNRSKETWILRGPGGSEQQIAPGRGLELSSSGAISFGPLQGTLRRDGR